MERQAFELLRDTEKGWWYRGRAHIVSTALRRAGIVRGEVLDYGAGPGGMIETFKDFGDVYGFEPDQISRDQAKERGYRHMYADEAHAFGRPYSIVAFCDVVEHIQDDRGLLTRVHTALQPGGHIVITVPANQWLWSPHDVSHHHFRRYSRSSLRKVLKDAGYDVVSLSYWNSMLFPVAIMMRLFGKAGEGSLGMPQFVQDVILSLIHIEAFIMRFFPLPFGLSLVAVARSRS